MFILLFWIMSPLCHGQPKSGHFIYNLIYYEIIDSAEVSERDATALIEWMKDQFYAEVHFNRLWVDALKNQNGGSRKSMYNQKSRVLYTYFYNDEIKRVRIDFMQALRRKDKTLLDGIDTLKSDLQIIEYPEETRMIHGYTCHKVTIAGFNNPPTLDEIWEAKFANVLDRIFPDEFYFLIEGIPLEIVQDFEGIKFKCGCGEYFAFKGRRCNF